MVYGFAVNPIEVSNLNAYLRAKDPSTVAAKLNPAKTNRAIKNESPESS